MLPVEVQSEALVETRGVYQIFTLVAVLYIFATDVLPVHTTLEACWKSSTSDSICVFVAFFLCN